MIAASTRGVLRGLFRDRLRGRLGREHVILQGITGYYRVSEEMRHVFLTWFQTYRSQLAANLFSSDTMIGPR